MAAWCLRCSARVVSATMVRSTGEVLVGPYDCSTARLAHRARGSRGAGTPVSRHAARASRGGAHACACRTATHRTPSGSAAGARRKCSTYCLAMSADCASLGSLSPAAALIARCCTGFASGPTPPALTGVSNSAVRRDNCGRPCTSRDGSSSSARLVAGDDVRVPVLGLQTVSTGEPFVEQVTQQPTNVAPPPARAFDHDARLQGTVSGTPSQGRASPATVLGLVHRTFAVGA